MSVQISIPQKKRPHPISLRFGENLPSRKQPFVRKNGKGRKKPPPLSYFGVPILNGTIKPLSCIEIEILQGKNENPFLKNHSLQLAISIDLFTIIQKHPDFVDKINWTAQTTTITLLTWLIAQFNALTGYNNNWFIQQPDEKLGIENYQVLSYKEYDTDTSIYYGLHLDFLLRLKSENLALHNLLVDLFSLLISKAEIDSWYSDRSSWITEQLKEELEYQLLEGELTEEEKQEWKDCIDSYEKGKASSYEALFNRNTTTLDRLKTKLEKSTYSTPIEKRFYNWIKTGIKVLETGKSVYDFCCIKNDHYQTGDYPLLPDQYMIFRWNEDDHFSGHHETYLQSISNETEVSPFTSWTIHKVTDETFTPLEESDFPELIIRFFEIGTELINDYTNPNKLINIL